jgi:general secretion pathway protein K
MSTRPADRGFALLIVLWTLVLITLVVTTMTATGRSAVQVAASLRDAAIARAAVDGAVTEAQFRLADGEWGRAPSTRILRIGDIAVQVQIEDEGGRVNINDAPLAMVVALLQGIGLPSAKATSLGAAIVDFRTIGPDPLPHGAKAPEYAAAGLPYGPTGQDFRTLDELGLVLGMTPDILARLAPYISIAKFGAPDLTKADPVVAEAFAEAGPNGGYPAALLRVGQVPTFHITARSLPPQPRVTKGTSIRFPAPGNG